MAASVAERIFTVAEYLEIERKTGAKHEFYNGKLKPMAGGSIPHNRISRNLLGLLHQMLRQRPGFEAFGSDQKIYLPKFHYYVYADVLVVAGEPVESDIERQAIINPILIVETLSPSTAGNDRGQKFVEYQSLPSFKEYVLLSQTAPEAVSYFREKPDLWRTSEVIGLDKLLPFRSIQTEVPMSEVYFKVEF